jgi:hypothetical protein
MGPSLKIVSFSWVRSMTVDATPSGDLPPSSIMSTRSPSSLEASWAVVAGGIPVRFALVPTRAPEHSPNSSKQTGCLGDRTPMFFLGVRIVGRISRAARIIVNGPGQNFSAILRARSGMYTSLSASSRSLTKTGIGFVRPPFASIVLLIAEGLSGSHPNPYKVSVG